MLLVQAPGPVFLPISAATYDHNWREFSRLGSLMCDCVFLGACQKTHPAGEICNVLRFCGSSGWEEAHSQGDLGPGEGEWAAGFATGALDGG